MPQPLASKERTLFQQVVKNYENKQYKKGLKAVEAILKKNPNHGDTQAMKALIINSTGHTDEAFALAKVALTNDMKSHVCWHVYGLLYRSIKNFEESIKAYKYALKLEPESQQIQRDLALLQIQMRDYPGYVQSRRAMLQSRPALRQNWTARAVAQHLDGDLEAAERTLTMYEESLRTPPSKSDLEHQECQLYKNTIIAEMGQIERALEHLDAISKGNYDRQTIMEMRAAYLLRLERREEAATVYRTLIDRNLENRSYYQGLQQALEIADSDIAKRKELYQTYAEKSPRADAPRRIPLDFLQGDEFRTAVEAYLQRMLTKGVPSTFANLKTLYADPTKQQTIQELVEDFHDGKSSTANGDTDTTKREEQAAQFALYTLYFLAQHYDYHKSRDLSRALTLIDQAIEKKPDNVDFHMTRGRIHKHKGDLAAASQIMEHARTLDERDRYINTKAAKYQLRHEENAEALANMGKFTRVDAVGGPLGDLIDMQCIWFLWEDGASWLRQNKLGLALKRFTSIYNVFDVWQEDQFDFHSFSMRRGQVRAYVELLRFENKLREHPFWTRTAVAAVHTYILLHDYPHLQRGEGEAHDKIEDQAALKKAAKKARKEKERQELKEAEKRDAKKTAGGKGDEEKKKEDNDPEGKELLDTKNPLGDAMKWLTPTLEMSPRCGEAQRVGFELYLRLRKLLPALRCLVAASHLSLSPSALHSMALRLAAATLSLSTTSDSSQSSTDFHPAVRSALDKHLPPLLPSPLSSSSSEITLDSLRSANEAFLSSSSSTPSTEKFCSLSPSSSSSCSSAEVQRVAAYVEVLAFLDPKAWAYEAGAETWTGTGDKVAGGKGNKVKGEALQKMVAAVRDSKGVTLSDARWAVEWCRDMGLDATPVRLAGGMRFGEGRSSLEIGMSGAERREKEKGGKDSS